MDDEITPNPVHLKESDKDSDDILDVPIAQLRYHSRNHAPTFLDPQPNSRPRPKPKGAGSVRARRKVATSRENFLSGTTDWVFEDFNTDALCFEKEFIESVVSERARMYCLAVVENLETQQNARVLPEGRLRYVALFLEPILRKTIEWLNELILLRKKDRKLLGLYDGFRFLAVLLMSHCTGFSLDKTISIMNENGLNPPRLELMHFILSNIMAFSPTLRFESEMTWVPQRDLTRNLTLFERTAFEETCKLFLAPLHLFCTLDDDLYGTRAKDNQVKTLSSRKADKEGHAADVIADSFFRVVLGVRFRRRGETGITGITRLFEALLEGRGEQSMRGMLLTADRGYGKKEVLEFMRGKGISAICVMPEHLIKCNPFVGASYLTPTRADEAECDYNRAELDTVPIRFDDTVANGKYATERTPFVIDDSSATGRAAFYARSKANRAQGSIRATAVREQGSDKFANVVRFLQDIPESMDIGMRQWVAVPKAERFDWHLYIDPECKNPLMNVLEEGLKLSCTVLTKAQRCVDWFILRQFRVTATLSGAALLRSKDVRDVLGLSPQRGDTTQAQANVMHELTTAWFSTKRSTETMIRGTTNENVVRAALRQLPFITGLFEAGMLGVKGENHFACSPDGVALIDLTIVRDQLEANGAVHVTGMHFGDMYLGLAAVEIKTRVAKSTVGSAVTHATESLIVMRIGAKELTEYVPAEHLCQILHQMFVLNVNLCLYVCVAETGLLYKVLIICDDEQRVLVGNTLRCCTESAVKWAHEETIVFPDDIDTNMRSLLQSKISFWKVVNEKVHREGPLPPIKPFKHSIQSLYSKTKGGVDGSTQARAIQRSSTSHLQWEQKIVTQVFKTLVVNGFIAWRMMERKDRLQTKILFGALDEYRHALNRVQSFADFVHDLSREMLHYAEKLENSEEEQNSRVVEKGELNRLLTLAANRKRTCT